MDLIQFLGRFHVLVLHLPIGILFMAAFIEIYWVYQRQARNPLIKAVWLWGAITASGAALLGYLLSLGGGYSEEAIATHRNWALSVIFCSFFCWFYLSKIAGQGKKIVGLSILQLVLLFSTGHYGANMTHGETYLVEHAPVFVQKMAGLKVREPVTSVEQASIYPDVVEPILMQRCSGCHNAQKSKGKLDLSSYPSTIKHAVKAHDLANSELYQRITLDKHDKKFMPAEGKTPLTDAQVNLIGWWIEQGALNDIKIAELNADLQIKQLIAKELQLGEFAKQPKVQIAELGEQVVVELEQAGFHVSRIQQDQPFVSLIYANLKQDINDETLKVLRKAKAQIKWLKLARTSVTDQQLSILTEFDNLEHLDISHTQVTNKGLDTLLSAKSSLRVNSFNTLVR
ncbi:c-type cytochrome domain-containing protein [Catenovulum sediminis]|uniref:C-type cytochrome domain-containing protein n=1 Tax=Catenovulum sediminis TaxID=1740262 RepID=A0ABV1RFQ8_9ALTE